MNISNAFRSSTFFNYCPGGGFSIGNITNHLKQARVKENRLVPGRIGMVRGFEGYTVRFTTSFYHSNLQKNWSST